MRSDRSHSALSLGLKLALLVVLCLMGCSAEKPLENPSQAANAPTGIQKTGQPSQPFSDNSSGRAARQRAEEIAANLVDEPEMVVPEADPNAFAKEMKSTPPPRPAGPELAALDTPRRTNAKLEALGFRVVSSPHIQLVTDLPLADVETLPGLGELLLQRLQADFDIRWPNDQQMVGYIMADPGRFREAGLLPEDLPGFLHGRHRGGEFWMKMQATPYYLRHLFLHELTHVVTLINEREDLPVGFKEGIAEWYATHYAPPGEKPLFAILPGDPANFPGWGRISLIQEDTQGEVFRSFDDLLQIDAIDFSTNDDYAWAWLWIQFCSQHPTYGPFFANLRQSRNPADFLERSEGLDPEIRRWLSSEWLRFAADVTYGYEVPLAQVKHLPPRPLGTTPQNVLVEARGGWQSTGLLVPAGAKVRIRARGQVELNRTTRPWMSQPQGISIDFARGERLGKLLAWWAVPDLSPMAKDPELVQVFPVGQTAPLTAPRDAVLYLRINDHFSGLGNNSGQYEVTVEAVDGEAASSVRATE